jgi:hypothetical protein
MLRLIHNQTVSGAILVDDIDDGLPNKTAHRLGSIGDPASYARDGYANYPKQPCYVPRTKPSNAAIQGYIDIRETERALLSAGKGKIAGLVRAGLITVVNFTQADVAAPTVTTAVLTVASGALIITGTAMTSLAPNQSSVVITGPGAVTLTQAAIVSGGGTFTDTSVSIPEALVPGVTVASLLSVTADDQAATPVLITFTVAAPTVATATKDSPTAGDLTIAGTHMASTSPSITSVIISGTGAVTLTQSQITTGGGTVGATSIVIPAALVPGIAAATSFVVVAADYQTSGTPVAVS